MIYIYKALDLISVKLEGFIFRDFSVFVHTKLTPTERLTKAKTSSDNYTISFQGSLVASVRVNIVVQVRFPCDHPLTPLKENARFSSHSLINTVPGDLFSTTIHWFSNV